MSSFQSIPTTMVTRKQPIDEALMMLIKQDLDSLFSMITDNIAFYLEDATAPYDLVGGYHMFSSAASVDQIFLGMLDSGKSGSTTVKINQWRPGNSTPIASATASLASNTGTPNSAVIALSSTLNFQANDFVTMDVVSVATGTPGYLRAQLMLAPGVGGTSGNPAPYTHTVTAAEITAKGFTLAYTPVDPTRVLLDPKGGPRAFYSDDYIVGPPNANNFLSWAGKGLDGILIAGDKLLITYG